MAADAELDALRAEVERLRKIIGPAERSCGELQGDLDGARHAAVAARAAGGELDGQLTAVYAQLARARQIESAVRTTFSRRSPPLRRRGLHGSRC